MKIYFRVGVIYYYIKTYSLAILSIGRLKFNGRQIGVQCARRSTIPYYYSSCYYHNNEIITVHQDNQSGMKLMNNGESISNKSKHMRVRYFYVKEKIDESIIELNYTPTNLMIADLLTKPLFGKQFETFVKQIYNNEDIFESVIYFIN